MRRTRATPGHRDRLGLTAGQGGSTGLGRRYYFTVLAATALLLMSTIGTTSASFTSQLSGGMRVEVVLPTDTPTPTPTAIDTPTPEPRATDTTTPTDTSAPTDTPTPSPTDTAIPSPTPAPQAS